MLIEKTFPKIKSSHNPPSLNMPAKPVPEKKSSANLGFEAKLGSTLSNDPLADKRFDFPFVTPPYGYEWSKDYDAVTTRRHRQNNPSVRHRLGQRGIKPETLPPLLPLSFSLFPSSPTSPCPPTSPAKATFTVSSTNFVLDDVLDSVQTNRRA